MPRLAFFTFAILREGYGHPRVKGFFDRVAANFAGAERCDGGPDGHPVELDRARVKALVRKNAGTVSES